MAHLFFHGVRGAESLVCRPGYFITSYPGISNVGGNKSPLASCNELGIRQVCLRLIPCKNSTRNIPLVPVLPDHHDE